jgi:hypothetical protein
MDFSKEAMDGLRAKGFTVGELYIQASAADVNSAPQFISVNGVHMPIKWAIDMNSGLVTLAEIESHLGRP